MERKMARKLNLVSDEAAGDVAGQIEALRTEMTELATAVSNLIAAKSSSLGATLSGRVHAGMEKTAAHAHELRDASMEGLTAASERAKDASLQMIDALSEEVRKHPTRTLAITLGIGLLLGVMSRSSR
jgi:ElaB/YqjD/DUF883 family membrane-anchored ribosome-binding protein